MSSYLDKIRDILRHIQNVQNNCIILGEKLIDDNQYEMAKKLIANGLIHDNSKFVGIEFEAFTSESPDPIMLKHAVIHHQKTNPHHPEYWANGIKDMPQLYIAEFVCDIKARSSEFGTDIRNWIDTEAAIKFNFKKEDKVYFDIMKYLDMICDKPFKKI